MKTITIGDSGSDDSALVGGKGANLGILSRAGFAVPGGFTVTTRCYTEFMAVTGLQDKTGALVDSFEYENSERLDGQAEEVRNLLLGAAMPEPIRSAIVQAYAELGAEPYVAVRSSGTAEDLADESFAGMHDSYLDVRRADEVVDAVQHCWASMWTSRAVAYRNRHGYDHRSAEIAVVVQTMVPAAASGVLFTGNPLTTCTSEIVVNASWGLGEAVVQGMVTPDTFVVDHAALAIKNRTLGSKDLHIVRNPNGKGTITESVPEGERARFCLDDETVVRLARLGRSIQDSYGGFPQDIEWALCDGELFVLQARPITGVAFSWDVDVEAAHTLDAPDDTIWTRAWADTVMTGVVTPLTYGARQIPFSDSIYSKFVDVLGLEDLAKVRSLKYWKGEIYYNADFDRTLLERTGWPALRPALMHHVPAAWRDDVLAAPFRPLDYAKAVARIQLLQSNCGIYEFLKTVEHWRTQRPDIEGLTATELELLSDSELKRYTDRMLGLEVEWGSTTWFGFFFWFRDVMALLAWMTQSWYDHADGMTFATLISGSTERTDTINENLALHDLAGDIRRSAELSERFTRFENREFFENLDDTEAGREFLSKYREFVAATGHRGSADRDIIHPRRAEDPSIDYRALAMLLSAPEAADPEIVEEQTNARRDETYRKVLEAIRSKPLGFLKAEAFKIVYDLAHRYIVVRDNERQRPTEVIVYSYKRGFVEIGRRLRQRGLIENDLDFYYLSKVELYDLLDGRTDHFDLTQAKIRARRYDCERMMSREWSPPMHMQHNHAVNLDLLSSDDVEGLYRGAPTSAGSCTGTARIVKRLEDIGRVKSGEILIVNSTDPGWTPVFMVVKALVVEAGGMLSHAGCLAREYGLPAVQLDNAMALIPDGATITVDGDGGTVTVHPETTGQDAS